MPQFAETRQTVVVSPEFRDEPGLFRRGRRGTMVHMSTTASETLLTHWIAGRRDTQPTSSAATRERPAERHGEVTDSATGEVVARVPFATTDDVDRAVAAAT